MSKLDSPGKKFESAEDYSSKIVMHFFRHAKQGPMGQDGKDETRALTPEGEMQALAAYAQVENPKLAKAITSPRIRAQQTGSIVMEGDKVLNTAGSNDASIPDSVEKGLLGAPRLETDDRLNFFSDPQTKTGHAMEEAYGKQQTLKFMLEDSDKIAKENGEMGETTYSRAAGAVASMIRDFVEAKDGKGSASDRWDAIVKKNESAEFKHIDKPVLERFFASHQTMTESFLAKVIEKTSGIEERTKFAEALGNAGFGFAEGYEVEIENKNGAKRIKINFEKKNKEGETVYAFSAPITKVLLDQIIAEATV